MPSGSSAGEEDQLHCDEMTHLHTMPPPAPCAHFVGCLAPSSAVPAAAAGALGGNVVCVPLQVALLRPGKHEVGEGAAAAWRGGEAEEGGGGAEETVLLPPAKLIVEA